RSPHEQLPVGDAEVACAAVAGANGRPVVARGLRSHIGLPRAVGRRLRGGDRLETARDGARDPHTLLGVGRARVELDSVAGRPGGAGRAPPAVPAGAGAASASPPVMADQSAHHVVLVVARVHPRPRTLLARAEGQGLSLADYLRTGGFPARRQPAVAVNLAGV